jgi:hypothetical protein
VEASTLEVSRPDGPCRTATRLLQFAIDQKLTVPLELSRSEKRVLYKTLDDTRRTVGFVRQPRLGALWFSLYDELADDLHGRPAGVPEGTTVQGVGDKVAAILSRQADGLGARRRPRRG